MNKSFLFFFLLHLLNIVIYSACVCQCESLHSGPKTKQNKMAKSLKNTLVVTKFLPLL